MQSQLKEIERVEQCYIDLLSYYVIKLSITSIV